MVVVLGEHSWVAPIRELRPEWVAVRAGRFFATAILIGGCVETLPVATARAVPDGAFAAAEVLLGVDLDGFFVTKDYRVLVSHAESVKAEERSAVPCTYMLVCFLPMSCFIFSRLTAGDPQVQQKTGW